MSDVQIFGKVERELTSETVTRRKPGRSYVYRPKVSRDALRQHALKQLLTGFFDGSVDALLNFLRQPREPRAKI